MVCQANAFRSRSSREAALDPKPLDAIGRALRAHYDDLLREPLPAQFEEPLAQLEAGERVKDARQRLRGRANSSREPFWRMRDRRGSATSLGRRSASEAEPSRLEVETDAFAPESKFEIGAKERYPWRSAAFWKGYLKLSLVTCPVARPGDQRQRKDPVSHPQPQNGQSRREPVCRRGELALPSRRTTRRKATRGGRRLPLLEDEDLESVRLESARTIEIKASTPAASSTGSGTTSRST